MWDSSLRTHPGLNIQSETKIRTVELLCSHFVVPEHTLDCEQFPFCWKIREEKHKDERKENATQVQAVISVRDLRNRTSRSQSRSHVDCIILCLSTILHDVAICTEKNLCFRYIKFVVPRFIGVNKRNRIKIEGRIISSLRFRYPNNIFPRVSHLTVPREGG